MIKTHRSFFIKGVVIVGAVLFILQLATPYMSYKQDCRMTQNLGEFNDEIDAIGGADVYVFSTHLMATNLEPLWFEHRTGWSCRHFGGVGYSVPLNMEICRHAVGRHKPKLVIFDIGPRASGLAEALDSEMEIKALAPLDLSLSKINYLNKIKRDSLSQEDLFNGLSEVSSSLYSMNEWGLFVNERPHFNLCKGYEPRVQRSLISNMSDSVFLRTYESVGASTSYFENGGSVDFMDYVKELADDGVQVVLLESTRLNSGAKVNLSKLKEAFKPLGSNVRVITLDDPQTKNKLKLNRSHFSDYESLTLKGAMLLTDYLSEILIDQLKLEGSNGIAIQVEDDLRCTRSEMIVSEHGDQVVQLYFDSLPKDSKTFQALLKLYPTKEGKGMLSDLSKKNSRDHDVVFVNFSEMKKVGDEYMLHLSAAYWTKLKKSNIKKITLQFYTHHLTDEVILYD